MMSQILLKFAVLLKGLRVCNCVKVCLGLLPRFNKDSLDDSLATAPSPGFAHQMLVFLLSFI